MAVGCSGRSVESGPRTVRRVVGDGSGCEWLLSVRRGVTRSCAGRKWHGWRAAGLDCSCAFRRRIRVYHHNQNAVFTGPVVSARVPSSSSSSSSRNSHPTPLPTTTSNNNVNFDFTVDFSLVWVLTVIILTRVGTPSLSNTAAPDSVWIHLLQPNPKHAISSASSLSLSSLGLFHLTPSQPSHHLHPCLSRSSLGLFHHTPSLVISSPSSLPPSVFSGSFPSRPKSMQPLYRHPHL